MRRQAFRVGVIGLGVGLQHVAGFERHPACEVVALCDRDEAKLSGLRSRYARCTLTPSAESILEDPDIQIVSIATYDNVHAAQTESAIRNGKHVFVEKPLCMSLDEAGRIRNLLERHPSLVLSCNLVLRLCPRFMDLKRRLDEGEFGRLFYVEGDYDYGRLDKITAGWRGRLDYYSVVYGGAVHLVDLLLWLSGESVVQVSAYGNRIASSGTAFKYNDLVVALLRFESGLVGKVSANFGCVRPHFHALSVYGTEATFVNDLPHARLFTSRGPDATPQTMDSPYPAVGKADLIHSFVEAVAGGPQPVVTADEVFRCMSVCSAIEESAASGEAVAVKYL